MKLNLPQPFLRSSSLDRILDSAVHFQNEGFQNEGFQNEGFQNEGFQNEGFLIEDLITIPKKYQKYYTKRDLIEKIGDVIGEYLEINLK